MPRYDFTCPKCTNAEEVDVKISEISGYEMKCSKCGTKMDRLFHQPFIQYIGHWPNQDVATKHLGGGMELRRK